MSARIFYNAVSGAAELSMSPTQFRRRSRKLGIVPGKFKRKSRTAGGAIAREIWTATQVEMIRRAE